MKKFFAFAAMAALALTSCDPEEIKGDGPSTGGETKVSGIVLNELSGADKFIELYNTGDETVSLAGWEFDKGVDFVFPEGAKIVGKGYAVVARDPAAFKRTYPSLPEPFGPWEGKLKKRCCSAASAFPRDIRSAANTARTSWT